MCMGCMSQAEFFVAGGGLGLQAVRMGLRRARPGGRVGRPVTDEEAAAFVAQLSPPADTPEPDPCASR